MDAPNIASKPTHKPWEFTGFPLLPTCHRTMAVFACLVKRAEWILARKRRGPRAGWLLLAWREPASAVPRRDRKMVPPSSRVICNSLVVETKLKATRALDER